MTGILVFFKMLNTNILWQRMTPRKKLQKSLAYFKNFHISSRQSLEAYQQKLIMTANPDSSTPTVSRLHPQMGAPVNLRCVGFGNRPGSKSQGRKSTAVTGGYYPSSHPVACERAASAVAGPSPRTSAMTRCGRITPGLLATGLVATSQPYEK